MTPQESNLAAMFSAHHVLLPIGVGLSYVLPIRLAANATEELINYLDALAASVEVIVVDGSPAAVFQDFEQRCPAASRHVAPDPDVRGFSNGKVAGVITGIRRASHDRIVIADDDVRYDARGLATMAALLENADIVRPQNYFAPLPWHACV